MPKQMRGNDPSAAPAAARVWADAGLVGLPTETVYGLAANADSPTAVARIYQVKGRPLDHPVIVHVTGAEALTSWAREVPAAAARLAGHFWPGPLTLVLPRSSRAGDYLTGGQDTIALRAPGHPVAHACLRAFAELTGDAAAGIAAPSANRFGRVSPTCAADVFADIGQFLAATDLIIDGGRSAVGVESTIVDCTGDAPRVLRSGAIGAGEIARAWGAADSPDPAAPPVPNSAAQEPRAPGMLEAHYAPRARVTLASGQDLASIAGRTTALLAPLQTATPPGWLRVAAPADAVAYAQELYGAFRAADAAGVQQLVVVLPTGEHALVTAIADRVRRAAVGSAEGNPHV